MPHSSAGRRAASAEDRAVISASDLVGIVALAGIVATLALCVIHRPMP